MDKKSRRMMQAMRAAQSSLQESALPMAGEACKFCRYRAAVQMAVIKSGKKKIVKKTSRTAVVALAAFLAALAISAYSIISFR